MSSSQPPSGERNPLGLDELIAILVAFGTIGAIFLLGNRQKSRSIECQKLAISSRFLSTCCYAREPGNINTCVAELSFAIARYNRGSLKTGCRTCCTFRADFTSKILRWGRSLFLPSQLAPSTPAPAITKPKADKPKADKPKVGPVILSDVPDKYWARPFIVALVDRKIFSDLTDSKFRPDEPMTRAELARLIQRMSDQEPIRKPIDFKDVNDNSPVAPAIDHTVKTGYLKGYPNNEFRPDKNIPRVEVIAALASGLNLKRSAKASKTLQIYTDRTKVPKWAVDKVAAATEAGIVVNHPKRALLQPNRTATRAEVAAMIYQAMAKKGQVPAKASEYVVKPSKLSK
jgi:hypothetical protein